MNNTRHSTEESSFSPKNWVTALNCTSKGRFREDVSDTSSSVLSSHNSDDTDDTADSKTCLNGLSHHQSSDFNHQNCTTEVPANLYMNGNGSLYTTR